MATLPLTYDIGDGIRITATFTNLSGGLADPTTIVFKLKAPSGTVTTPTVTHLSTGVYYVDVIPNVKGSWLYRWEGTGAVAVAEEGKFLVRASAFV
jgi:hypothetical protein